MERIRKIKNQKSNVKSIGILMLILAGAVFANTQYPGLMPEVLVAAPRIDNESNGMMPVVEVTAVRPESPNREIAMVTDNPHVYDDVVYTGPADYTKFTQQLFEISDQEDLPELDYLLAKVKVRIERESKKVSSLIIDAGDTLKEDLEFSGKSGLISGVLKGDLAIIGGELDIAETGKVEGDIAVMGGSIANHGTIENDLAVFGGSFYNNGILNGDIFVAGGNVKLDSGSMIAGDIAIVGGSLEKDTHAIVKGEVKSVEIKVLGKALPKFSNLLKMSRTFPRALTMTGGAVATLLILGGLFVIMLIVLLVFPKSPVKVAETTNKNVWIPIAIGFGMQLLIVPLIVLLAVSIVGIPVIPVFMLGLFACLIVGLTSVFYLIGMRVQRTDEGKGSMIAKFAIGFIIIMAIPLLGAIIRIFSPVGGLFSVLGAIIIYVVATIGLGAAFYTLVTRKKS
jgi:hypothetical protein